MVPPVPGQAARRRGPASRARLRLVVFHASPDVQTHIDPLRRSRKFKIECRSQSAVPANPPIDDVKMVLWELGPGRRPNWKRLGGLVRGIPVVSYSASESAEVADRSRAIGFASHLAAPLSAVEIEHLIVLASSGDLAARLRRSQPMLRRYLGRVEVITEMHRAVSEWLEPARVADALVGRAAAWLPAASWAVVGPEGADATTVIAERGLAAGAEVAAREVGAWVIDHAREYAAASLRHDPSITNAPDVAAIAVPLICRGRTVAALVGIDREPSPQVPELSESLLTTLGALLTPVAFALDNALRVQRAEELSLTDDLTQLYNSRYLSQALRREGKRAARNRQPLSLLFIDLDGFKGINDQHGHLYGSRALVEAAGIIRDCSRETDVAARFGGDEFAIVLPDTGREGGLAVAKRVRDRIRDHVFLEEEGIDFRLTTSVGVATMPDIAASAEALLQAADDAMYWVKAHGKDGIQLAGAASQEGMSA